MWEPVSRNPRLRSLVERADGYLWARWIFLRALGLIFFSAFYSLAFQIHGLIGERGLLPVTGYLDVIRNAVRLGYDIVSGMHARLATIAGLADLAREQGVRLIDVRVPPSDIPVATGAKRSGQRLLTVGTDCAIGKKYTALAIDRALRAQRRKSTFRATCMACTAKRSPCP